MGDLPEKGNGFSVSIIQALSRSDSDDVSVSGDTEIVDHSDLDSSDVEGDSNADSDAEELYDMTGVEPASDTYIPTVSDILNGTY